MSIEDPKFQKVVPNTAKVIYSWDEKILSFSKIQSFVNRKFIKMTTLLIFMSKQKC